MGHHAIGGSSCQFLERLLLFSARGYLAPPFGDSSADDFPSRIRLGVNSVGWNSDEIEAWIERRPRGATTLAATLEDRHSQRGI